MGIEGVIFNEKVGGVSRDGVDLVGDIWNGDIEGFNPLTIRTIYFPEENMVRGNHWRECNEVLYHLEGSDALIRLSGGIVIQSEFIPIVYEQYTMKKGSRLFIPSNTALRVEGNRGLILLSMIDRKFVADAPWYHKIENPDEYWSQFRE